jgi:hypothetical protein
MSTFPYFLALFLFGLALLGDLAVLPYSFNLAGANLSKTKLPKPVLVLVSFLQTAIIMAIAVFVGLLAARQVGLGVPYIQALLSGKAVFPAFPSLLPVAIGLGILSFVVMALFERFVFAPYVPAALQNSDVSAKVWMRFLASLYGGVDEEILTRLFLVSGLAWLIGHFWQGNTGRPANGAVWLAIVLAAVLFGLGHLPATRAITLLTPRLILRAVVLNGVPGIACGWLFWRYGLEAAMVAHFSADILLHVVGPLFIKKIYKNSSVQDIP